MAEQIKPTVLLIGTINQAHQHWLSLSSKYTLLAYPPTPSSLGTRADFITQLATNPAYRDLLACYRSNRSTSLTGPFDAELISHLPSTFKYIAHNGAGYDNIDISACSEKGIAVSSTPGAVDDATADTGILLMLGALRRVQPGITAIKAGEWQGKSGGLEKGHDPRGKILGILGMGGIGRAMAKRAVGFGMEVVYHNRKRLDEKLEILGGRIREDGEGLEEIRARYVSFEELLGVSDVLSLNLALNEKTKGIISKKELGMLKRGAVVVNTARGGLIVEADLVEALNSGQVSAVGLDVFEKEPEVHQGLIDNDRAFLLPHMGTMTLETELEMEMLVLRNLESGVDRGKLLTLVAEQKGLEWAEGNSG